MGRRLKMRPVMMVMTLIMMDVASFVKFNRNAFVSEGHQESQANALAKKKREHLLIWVEMELFLTGHYSRLHCLRFPNAFRIHLVIGNY